MTIISVDELPSAVRFTTAEGLVILVRTSISSITEPCRFGLPIALT